MLAIKKTLHKRLMYTEPHLSLSTDTIQQHYSGNI